MPDVRWLSRCRAALAGVLVAALAPAPADGALTVSRFGTGFAETAPGTILIAADDGSASRVLTTGFTSFLSPDGARVAVTTADVIGVEESGNSMLGAWRLDVFASAGGAPVQTLAAECWGAKWSPDSTKLACVTPSGLTVLDAATGAATTVASGALDAQVSFSPDSASLAYVQRRTLRIVDLASGASRRLRASASTPVWGPKTIAFVTRRRGTYDVSVIRPDGRGLRRLTRFRSDASQFGVIPVAWSRDGRRLVGHGIGENASYEWVTYAIDARRGGYRQLANGVRPFALSGDGHQVIGQTGSAATTGLYGSNVVRVPWSGGRPRVLLRHAVNPSFNG